MIWAPVISALSAPEGPAMGPADWILVCGRSSLASAHHLPNSGADIVAARLDHVASPRLVARTSTLDKEGLPAGLAFGPTESLFIADAGQKAIIRIDRDGEQSKLVSTFQGDPLNGPNDLAFDSAGRLFFTDPGSSSQDRPVGNVFCVDPITAETRIVDRRMRFPNGVVAHDDHLYVTETFTRLIWIYEVDENGRVRERRVFCRLPAVGSTPVSGPDGMCLDEDGNVYVAHFGGAAVLVYGPDGRALEVIAVPGRFPTNVCFGGPDNRTLFVTVDDARQLLAADIGVTGRRLPFCISERSPWLEILGASPRLHDGQEQHEVGS